MKDKSFKQKMFHFKNRLLKRSIFRKRKEWSYTWLRQRKIRQDYTV